MISFSFASYLLIAQNTIYSTELMFRVDSDWRDSKSGVAELLPGTFRSSSQADFLAIVSSNSFHNALAKKIVVHRSFHELDLKRISEVGHSSYRDAIERCYKNVSCKEEVVTSHLGSLISVYQSSGRQNTYSLRVRSTDFLTSQVLINIASQALVDYRLENQREFISLQRDTVSDVLKNYRSSLNDHNYRGLSSRIDELNRREDDARLKQRQVFLLYQQKSLHLETVKNQLENYRRAQSRQQDFSYVQQADRAQRLMETIHRLKSDINILELSSSNFNSPDNEIFQALQQELEVRQQEFQEKYKNSDLLTSANGNASRHGLPESYQVALNEYRQVQTKHDHLMEEIREIHKERDTIMEKVATLKSKDTLVQNLEQRLLLSDLAASTITPDIIFFDQAPSMSSFTRITLLRYIFFIIALTLFFTPILVSIRFMRDKRIYDTSELSQFFEEIPILGHAPQLKKSA